MMVKRQGKGTSVAIAEYREESAKIPFVVMAVLVLIIGGLLGWLIFKIDTEGTHAANVSKYDALIQTVFADTQDISIMLKDGSLGRVSRKRTITLIVPEVVLVDENESKAQSPLKIELKGIYWNPTRPLVDIDNKTYYVGDKVQGYTIVKINKTAVHFKSQDGGIVVKEFYENLLQIKK